MSTLPWYWTRLSAMSPIEIPFRASHVLWRQLGRWRRWPPANSIKLSDVWNGPSSFEECRASCPGFPPMPHVQDAEGYPADWYDNCVAEAKLLLHHRVSLFAWDRKALDAAIDWNYDYSTRRPTPLLYAPLLNHRDSRRVGDVKYVWELGRMQHLTRLAQAWRLTGDERFAREVVDQIVSWITTCPHMMGIHWASPMEAALRMISWTWALQLIRDWEGLDAPFFHLVIRSIFQHLVFIHGNYSRFSSANNHLIAEASGAYFAAGYWTHLKDANRWRTRAKRHLVRECHRQICADGVGREQAFGYQFFVWDLLLIAALMGRAIGDEFPRSYWDRLESMAEFVAWITDGNGNTPNVGDADDGKAVRLSQRDAVPAKSMMNTAAMIWRRSEFSDWAGTSMDERTAWLLGGLPVGADGHANPRRRAVSGRKSRSFPEGGYVVLRHGGTPEDEVLLVFDVGDLGWPATGVHGHADALSVLLHLGGEPVFIDPGTYSYEDTPQRHYFRATAQHNTLSFGDQDQSQYLNRFMWGKRPRVELREMSLEQEPQVVDGQVVWWTGARHRRRIEFFPEAQRVRIHDSWEGPEAPCIRFVLSPDVAAHLSEGAFVIDSQSANLRVTHDSMDGVLEPCQVSDRCYHRRASRRLCFRPLDPAGEAVTTVTWRFKTHGGTAT